MATSRTGTGTWKKVRAERLKLDYEAGVTHCPICGCWLDWENSRRPNSPEPDHIVPHSMGGQDTVDNTRTICRFDNQSRGDGTRKPKRTRPVIKTVTLDAAGAW
ncbi:HNH endonuclease signature motif containing protein [Citricoccus sp. K5]|uniref:HNH endonuclease signature motif containing protein n=1 Tax=Citricoccus sp. K5 TaxID=2653135 RepID=UPI0012F0D5C4|nr:HNH endonuclease [Citricoccus sp. K5]